jgi:hypothetical protein
LITQGKYNKLVYIPISSLLMPKYIRTDTEIMIAYGKPDAKFKTESNTKDYCLFSFEAFYIRLNFIV